MLAALAVLATATMAGAQFVPGNLAVSRVGDGSSALTNSATPSFVDQYTVLGVLVNSVAMPTSLNSPNLRLTNSGTATSELQLNLSTDGQYLTLCGYDADPGTTAIASSTATRVIGRVAMDGSVDTTTGLGTIYSGNNIRSAFTTNGLDFWASGAAGGIAYSPLGGAGASIISNTITNSRVVQIWNGSVYFTTGSGSANRGIWKIDGLPTSGPVTATQVLATGTSSSPYDFIIKDSNTIFVADDSQNATGGIQKWTFDGSAWTRAYVGQQTVNIGMRSLATDGTNLFAVTADNKVVETTDEGGGFGAFTVIATAPTNEAFRAVEYLPITEVNVAPTSFTVTRGSLQSGDLSSLLNSDDNDLIVRGVTPFSVLGDHLMLVLDGTSPIKNPTEFSFSVESHVTMPGLTTKIYFFNWQTNSYELVDSRSGSLSDNMITIGGQGDLTRFVEQTTGAVRVQLAVKQTNLFSIGQWKGAYDQTFWTVKP